MSWIESHQSLLTHRKTLRASAILKVNKHQVIGHMHALWWWALDNAEDDGCLGEILPEELAEAAGWPARKAAEFMAALETVKFIERTDCGYTLHNWYKYAGKLNEKKAKDRARKAESSGNSSGFPAEVAEKSQAPTNPPTPTVPTNLTNLPTGDGGRRDIFRWYEEVFGMGTINSIVREELLALEEEHPKDCIEHCFKAAALKVPRPKSLTYVSTTLRHHREDGCDGSNANRAIRGQQATGTNPGAVAAGVSDMERRRAALAERRRAGVT